MTAKPLLLALLGLTPLTLATRLTPGLEIAHSLDLATQGISISADGRKFLSQRYSTTLPPQAVELVQRKRPALLTLQTLLDGGSTGVNGSTKLVGVNLTTNAVDKLYYLDALQASTSGIDDVRFNAANTVAYLSDTAGALLVLNMTSGTGVRVLSADDSAQAFFPMMYNGTLVPGYGAPGSTLSVGLDQIEVSPDGVYLYYQPCNGGMYRIETAYVDAALGNATLAETLGDYAEPFALTPSTGGTTIDGDGNIYVSDTNLLAIWKVTPEGRATILIQDEALLWTDLVWVTADKRLWLPASQMRPGGSGLMADGPNYILTYPIETGPSAIDHA
ncbi:hypothetical protein BO71DRAFT_432183 [Aspergillus ellipticus CBS 707.79]|uniref:Major royal jelly protein n=1 Tax=Aspergillus ellipticus CBS 707.79 TaxID=1448320 RepID=A0A319DCZ3_9EURO|nr:hypothetical protein BO71DRAFT_432183 [Aspergillus ellipticus CBS 707.79]